MKSNKISFIFNLIVVSVLLFSGVFTPGKAAPAVEAALLTSAQMDPPIVTFEGLQRNVSDPAFTDTDSDLPDTSGAVGRTRFIQAVNKSVGIFKKTGTLVASATFEQFWTGANTGTVCDGGSGYHHGQPTVLYDHMGQRWFIADLAYADVDNGPYYFCIAVTNTVVKDTPVDFTGQVPDGNPVNPPVGSWWFYTLKAQENAPYQLPNQPKFGLWGDGYYLAFDQYDVYNNGKSRTPFGARVWAVNRDDLNSGIPVFHARTSYMPEEMNFHGLIPATLEGNPPTSGTPEFFAAIAPQNRFYLFRFLVNWISPDQSVFNQTPTTLSMGQSYTGAVGFLVPQKGTTEKLDLIGDRLTSLKYREVSQCADTTTYCTDVAASLWAVHTGWNGSAGALRWYEIRDPNTNPSFYQEGVYSPTSDTRWVGDLAVDQQGDMALGYSVSGSTMYPSIRYTGRSYSDPLNTLIAGEAPLVDETTTTFKDNLNGVADGAWGHHSAMSVDPVDECVFWYTNEYFNNADAAPNTNWHTKIGWFRFPSCGEGMLDRVSLSTNDVQGNDSSGIDFAAYSTAVSANGRYVAFTSAATNLVTGDTKGKRDVFLRDRDVDADGIFDEPGQVSTIRITNGLSGTESNGDSWQVSMSSDGRFTAFSSNASNLVVGDNNGTQDVFLYDNSTKVITRVSVNTAGVEGNGQSDQPAISGNGRYVAFRSRAANLVGDDLNSLGDIFFRDTYTGQTTRVSISDTEVEALGESYSPAITYDGRYVAFASRAANLVTGDSNGFADIFIRDRLNNNTRLVSVAPDGVTPGDGESSDPSITITESQVRIAFASQAMNLTSVVMVDPNQIFVRAMDFNLAPAPATPDWPSPTMPISTSYVGAEGDHDSFAPAISQDGKFVAYASDAQNLGLQTDYNGVRDIFLRNLTTGLTQYISVGVNGAPSNGHSQDPAISADGRQVVFASNASNLVVNDTNAKWDVFVYDKRGSVPNFLTIPSNIMGQPGATISVPVNFNPGGQQIDSTSFSIDYDENCLTFANTADSVAFNVGSSFNTQFSFAASDTDGEIDFWIYPKSSPAPTLQQGLLLTVRLNVKSSCQAASGTSKTARVGFSKDPQASFGRNGASIAARTTDGSVTVLAGTAGDCNSDGSLNAGDISALVNEIFDSDGNLPADAPFGTFAGSPVGCNPNNDVVIDAGDISCMTQLLFGHACSGAASANRLQALTVASVSSDPLVSLSGPAAVLKGGQVNVPIQYAANGRAVNALVFSLSYNPAQMTFDPTDANADGIPDALRLAVPAGFTAAVTFQPNQASDQIGVAVFPTSASAFLPDGSLGDLTFGIPSNAAQGEANVSFGSNPVVSFGAGGQSLKGSYSGYTTQITSHLRVFIPAVTQPGK